MLSNIKFYREQKNMTQEELSEKSGISRTTICLLETGKTNITTNITMKKIAEALGETVSAVFFEEIV